MTPAARHLVLALGLGCLAAPVVRAGDIEIWTDARGDAVIRRTDLTNSGPLNPASVLPDVVRVTLSGWQSPTPATDPFTGSITSNNPRLFRLDVAFAGVVNPPGTVDLLNFAPFQFGPSPVLGFLEFDIDNDRDTGGELGAAAKHRYLANVGRFGRLPEGSLGSERGVRWGTELDDNYFTGPQYERNGTDFAMVFCGCHPTNVVVEGGNGNGVFEAGETWIIRGPFWQRAGGYRLASFMLGGPQPGLWQPEVRLRWSHDIASNETRVTLVYALDMIGAAQLAGAAQPQGVNYSYGANDHTSMQEAVQDLIDFATWSPPPPRPPHRDLAIGWANRTVSQYLDPTRWKAKGIFGTSYAVHQPGAPYVWTDVGFKDKLGDLNHDGSVNNQDRSIVRSAIASLDGGPLDADGIVNGSVQIIGFGLNFCAYDISGDGKIGIMDSIWYCPADMNDDGALNIADFSAFIQAYAAGHPWADVNRDGNLNIADFTAFLQAYAAGCP